MLHHSRRSGPTARNEVALSPSRPRRTDVRGRSACARAVHGAIAAALIVAATLCPLHGSTFTPVTIKGRPAHPTRILAKVAAGSTVASHASTLAMHQLVATRDYGLVPGLVLLEVDSPVVAMSANRTAAASPLAEDPAHALQRRIEALRRSGLYEFVEPDFLVKPDRVPSDTNFSNGTLWALRNTGQSGGLAGVDIDAVRAWDVTTGSTSVVVAVIDSGIRYTHTDLAGNMWRNPREIAGNGRDDDNNGYIDDVFGINAVAGTGDPMDDVGHGTHIAGTIGATANGGGAHVGVAWNVRLMACKFFDNAEGGTFSDLLECYDYAVAHGAQVLNCSFGSTGASNSERAALTAARDRGVLVVASAGNSGTNNDVTPHYPSGYDLGNVISVAAIDRRGVRASFSNYGPTSVHLGAPGIEISSTYHQSDSSYATVQGTSMAAPHVAGVAALVLARFPGISVFDLRDRVVHTATSTPALGGMTISGGRVNAYQALTSNGDGQLKLAVTPAFGTTLYHGRSVPVSVRVRDLLGVTGATVSATTSSGASLTFRDDGIAPDATPRDGHYTATLQVPASGFQLSVTVSATAPGKSPATSTGIYSLQPPPPNDHFAARITLPFSQGTTTASNVGATREPGEPRITDDDGGASLWWTWTAPGDATVTIDTVGSDFDTLLGVYVGSTVDALTEIASNDDIDGPNQPSRVSFHATSGTVYQIAVDGWSGKTGSITLRLSAAIPPANDNFANRQVLTGTSVTTTGQLANATFEPGEPADNQVYPRTASIWYEWTAPASGTAVLTHTGWTMSGIFTGSTLASLTPVPRRHSDDILSFDTFSVSAGTAYHFAILETINGPDQPTTLALTLRDAPANDHFANRIALSGTRVTTTGSNVDATRQTNEPQANTNAGGASVWWTWTAPASGTLEIDVPSTSFNPIVAIFTGTELQALSPVAASGHQSPVRLSIPVTAGVAYQIAVDGQYSSTGTLTLRLAWNEPPANDRFANRAVLSGTQAQVAGTVAGASTEPGEALYNSSSEGRTVWWTWTAPATGTAIVYAEPPAGTYATFNTAVYRGSSLATLTRELDSGEWYVYPERGYVFHAEAGVTYAIAVDRQSGGAAEAFTLKLALRDCPPNDMFAQRAVLSGSTLTVRASNAYATRESLEPGHGLSPPGPRSVWWTWTAPTTGTVNLATAGESSRLYSIIVYTGDTPGALTPVSIRSNTVQFQAAAGTTYQIVVFGATNTGQFTLHLFSGTAPANNLFAQAATLTGASARATGTNRGATTEDAEYYHGGTTANASVWWNWTAPANARTVITTTGSNFATLLDVYTGSVFGSNMTSVRGYGDNVFGRNAQVVAFNAVAGTTYRIAVDGYLRELGDIVLNLTSGAPPSNDRFADRTPQAGAEWTATGSNQVASTESDEPWNGIEPSVASVWWSWTAPHSGRALVETVGSGIETVLAAYTGTAPGSLTRIASNQADPEAGNASRITFDATAGETYSFAVDGHWGALGPVTLRLRMGALPAGSIAPQATPAAGRTLTLAAQVAGGGTQSYQWLRDGTEIPGATSATLTIPSLQAFHAGTYVVRLRNEFGSASSGSAVIEVPAPEPSESRLLNLSTRGFGQSGENMLIPGFVITGTGTRQVLMRAVGPQLDAFGVAGTMPDPRMTLRRSHNGSTEIIATNDDWGLNTNAEQIRATAVRVGAFALRPGGKDASLLLDLAPGSYTVTAEDGAGGSGIAMVELYDAAVDSGAPAGGARLVNLSNRGYVGTDARVMIPGFVVSEEGPKTLLLRAVGPKLASFGVSGVLPDPKLTIYRRVPGTDTSELILTNDNWGENGDAAAVVATAARVSAFALEAGSRDAAFVVTLPPGIYTVHASGAGGTTGVALVELYVVD